MSISVTAETKINILLFQNTTRTIRNAINPGRNRVKTRVMTGIRPGSKPGYCNRKQKIVLEKSNNPGQNRVTTRVMTGFRPGSGPVVGLPGSDPGQNRVMTRVRPSENRKKIMEIIDIPWCSLPTLDPGTTYRPCEAPTS